MRPFWIALQFLTRLPSPAVDYVDDDLIGRSALFYPVVGALIGVLLLTASCLLTLEPFHDFLSNAANVAAALVLILWVSLTGALHLDGLGDSADAWLGGGRDKQRSLDIMKDPRAGTAAVVTIVLLLLVKFTALAQLFSHPTIWPILYAPVLGRSAALALLLTTPSTRSEGFAAQVTKNLPRRTAGSIIIGIGLLIVFVSPMMGSLLLLSTVVISLLLRRLMLKRLDGTTGDTCGALVEIIEATCLVSLCFFYNY